MRTRVARDCDRVLSCNSAHQRHNLQFNVALIKKQQRTSVAGEGSISEYTLEAVEAEVSTMSRPARISCATTIRVLTTRTAAYAA